MPRRAKPYSTLPSFDDLFFPDQQLQLHAPLGHGTYGVVYSGTCTSSSRARAIKVLQRGPRAHAEVAAHARVAGHRGVVRLHAAFECEDSFTMLVMDRAEGGTMLEYMERTGAYWRAEVLVRAHFGQLLDAVEWCHAQGVYHRDLKPQNILMSADALQVYLSDFGLATSDAASTEWRCGTRVYMSPENLNELSPGACASYSPARTDLWALGIILASMLCHCTPWRAASPADALFMAYAEQGQCLRETLPISREGARIVAGLLAVRPAERWGLRTAREEMCRARRMFASAEEVACAPEMVRIVAEEAAAAVIKDEDSLGVVVEVCEEDATSFETDRLRRAWAARGGSEFEMSRQLESDEDEEEEEDESGGWWGSRGPLYVVNASSLDAGDVEDRQKQGSPESLSSSSVPSGTPDNHTTTTTTTTTMGGPVTPPLSEVAEEALRVRGDSGADGIWVLSKHHHGFREWANALWRRTGKGI